MGLSGTSTVPSHGYPVHDLTLLFEYILFGICVIASSKILFIELSFI